MKTDQILLAEYRDSQPQPLRLRIRRSSQSTPEHGEPKAGRSPQGATLERRELRALMWPVRAKRLTERA